MPIAFTTTGTFSNPTGGCSRAAANTITCSGYTLTFSSVPAVQDVPLGFTSLVDFGQVAVTGNNVNLVAGGGSMDLQITQAIAAPAGGSPFSYSASLVAQLIVNASGSFLQFTGPFNHTVTGTSYDVVYNLTEADHGTAGRSDISGSGQDPLNISGTIMPMTPAPPAPVPEPAPWVLLGSGLLIAGRKLRKKDQESLIVSLEFYALSKSRRWPEPAPVFFGSCLAPARQFLLG